MVQYFKYFILDDSHKFKKKFSYQGNVIQDRYI